jgi:hypothetical protein
LIGVCSNCYRDENNQDSHDFLTKIKTKASLVRNPNYEIKNKNKNIRHPYNNPTKFYCKEKQNKAMIKICTQN